MGRVDKFIYMAVFNNGQTEMVVCENIEKAVQIVKGELELGLRSDDEDCTFDNIVCIEKLAKFEY